ncbi:MAG: disulfide oxidoreductase [Bacteriovoracaceae bacterium]
MFLDFRLFGYLEYIFEQEIKYSGILKLLFIKSFSTPILGSGVDLSETRCYRAAMRVLFSTFLPWTTALIATFGSLFFSEIMDFEPCRLCWYQRILMYPLVLIYFVGAFDKSLQGNKYARPFIFLGICFSFYHLLLQWGVLPESASPCVEGISCSAYYIKWFGLITIPTLSFIAFLLLAFFSFMETRYEK